MAKFHVALMRLSFSGAGPLPVTNFEAVESEVLDTDANESSSIYPTEDGLFWVVTPLSNVGGWFVLGSEGSASVTPGLPQVALEDGNPVLPSSKDAWKAPKYRRIGVEPFA